ncbi:MAG TPA: 50S ribosomal protein L10 [Solirubrobacteraceae bacterium]|nr:50S ribosomal protein L10 [Solirubrobacteraceae bacterium]
MNRDQKATAIADIAERIGDSQAIFAVDYRGITVAQIAELRSNLRAADATFAVVKNSLTERAADEVGAEVLKEFLAGPTALTFVRGDAAVAAKAIADYARTTQLLPFKGGLMDGSPLDVDQIRALSKLPSREVLYGQLVGVVASPVGGLVRSLAALLGGLASALGQVREKKESGEIPSGETPAPAEEAPAVEAATEAETPAEEAPSAEAASEEAPAAEQPEAAAEEAPAAEAAEEAPAAEVEAPAEEAQAEPAEEPEQTDDNDVDAEAETGPEDAAAETNKED